MEFRPLIKCSDWSVVRFCRSCSHETWINEVSRLKKRWKWERIITNEPRSVNDYHELVINVLNQPDFHIKDATIADVKHFEFIFINCILFTRV